jgi:hypothetical protein
MDIILNEKTNHIELVIINMAIKCDSVASYCWHFLGNFASKDTIESCLMWYAVDQDIIQILFNVLSSLVIEELIPLIVDLGFEVPELSSVFLNDDILGKIFPLRSCLLTLFVMNIHRKINIFTS